MADGQVVTPTTTGSQTPEQTPVTICTEALIFPSAIMIMMTEDLQPKTQQMLAVKVAEKKIITLINVHFIVIFAKNLVISSMIV